jgi:hypothetical protein
MNHEQGAQLPGSVESDTPEWLDLLVTDRVRSFVEGEASSSSASVSHWHHGVGPAFEAPLRRLRRSAVPLFLRGLLGRVRLAMRRARQPVLGATAGSIKGG